MVACLHWCVGACVSAWLDKTCDADAGRVSSPPDGPSAVALCALEAASTVLCVAFKGGDLGTAVTAAVPAAAECLRPTPKYKTRSRDPREQM